MFLAQNPSDIVVELEHWVGYRPGEIIFVPLQMRQALIYFGFASIQSVLDGQRKVLVCRIEAVHAASNMRRGRWIGQREAGPAFL